MLLFIHIIAARNVIFVGKMEYTVQKKYTEVFASFTFILAHFVFTVVGGIVYVLIKNCPNPQISPIKE